MCFSAEASFVASAGLAVVGVATLRQVKEPSDRMVAAIPIVFAAHQLVEGVVWSTTPGEAPHLLAARLFALLAYTVWPIYLPLAFFSYEHEAARKRWLLGLVALGTLAGLNFLVLMIDDPVEPAVRCGSLQYRFHNPQIYLSHIVYGIPVMLAPALSRDKVFRAFGAGLLVAYLVAYYTWFKTHPSVWCYFAALLSALIYLHFRLRDEPVRAESAGAG
jgi:hypothetical protein